MKLSSMTLSVLSVKPLTSEKFKLVPTQQYSSSLFCSYMRNYALFSVCTFMSSALLTTEVHACHASMLTIIAPSFILYPPLLLLFSRRVPFYKLRKQPHYPEVLFYETINTQPQIVFGPLTMQIASVSEESVYFRNLTSSKVQGCIGNQMH